MAFSIKISGYFGIFLHTWIFKQDPFWEKKSKQAANIVEKNEGLVQIIFMKLIDELINHITYYLIKFNVQNVVFCLEGQIGANGVI